MLAPILILLVESRTLISTDAGDEKWRLTFNQRIVGDGKIVFTARSAAFDGSVSCSHKEFDMRGQPILQWQEGFWSNRWNRFESTYGQSEAVLSINGEKKPTARSRKEFTDPTVLWFWKVQPKVGSSVTVTYLAQNVPTTFQIKHTYEGVEELSLQGRTEKLHRVRQDPVGSSGVYTTWWYDRKGMGVKRYHKTTQGEYRLELKAWN